MPATILSSALFGIDARLVHVEADVHRGLPYMTVVGLPDAAVQETKERVRSAMKNSGYDFPLGRVTINLAPADWKKEGTGFDLPVALALLTATAQMPDILGDVMAIGELNLGGQVRPVPGALAAAELAKAERKRLIVPRENAEEAALISGVTVIPAATLADVVEATAMRAPWPAYRRRRGAERQPTLPEIWPSVRGQSHAKRAMLIAAAGHHNVLLIGPPGSGKTMLAQAARELLPPLREDEALDVTKIYSAAGRLPSGTLIRARPFRQPHHTSSVAALIGGGRMPKPGELSLAHHGILFLDEFPEFSRDHVEALRQPLENGHVIVNRVAGVLEFPAAGMLVAAMNPCPCGFRGDSSRPCGCSPALVQRYQRRISGPILDRFDIFIHVPRVEAKTLEEPESDDDPRALVASARATQSAANGGVANGRLSGKKLGERCELGTAERRLLQQAMESMRFSMRAYARILRVSRTIADLAGNEKIAAGHIAEALQYRPPLSLSG